MLFMWSFSQWSASRAPSPAPAPPSASPALAPGNARRPVLWLLSVGVSRYQDAALGTARDMKIGDWGKPLAAVGRTGFRLLGPLAVKASAGR